MASSAGDGGGGSRPFSSRARSAGRFFNRQNERQKAAIDEQKFDEEIQHLSEDLNVRVRERDPTAADERPRSRLGSLKFSKSGNESSSAVGGGTSASLEQKANELKGTLSNIFRRSQSTDRSSQQQQQHGGMAQQSSPPQSMAPIPSSLPPPASSNPAPRGPLTSSRQPQGIGRPPTATTAANRGTANSGNQNNNNLIVANGNPSMGIGTTNSNNITTTAIRPFSAFPGKRAAQSTVEQTSSTNQSNSAKFETDLSEQASIAPHISMRRISAIATDPASLFFNRQYPQSTTGNVQQTNRGSARKNGAAEEIDVNFLSRFLCPEDEIQDEQIPWTWDSLFASVTSELREEWALEEEANNNEGAGGAEMGPAAAVGIMPNGMAQQQQQRQGQGYVQQRGF